MRECWYVLPLLFSPARARARIVCLTQDAAAAEVCPVEDLVAVNAAMRVAVLPHWFAQPYFRALRYRLQENSEKQTAATAKVTEREPTFLAWRENSSLEPARGPPSVRPLSLVQLASRKPLLCSNLPHVVLAQHHPIIAIVRLKVLIIRSARPLPRQLSQPRRPHAPLYVHHNRRTSIPINSLRSEERKHRHLPVGTRLKKSPLRRRFSSSGGCITSTRPHSPSY